MRKRLENVIQYVMNPEVSYLLGKNMVIAGVPTPLSVILETIDECKSANELAAKFSLLKHELQEYADNANKNLLGIPYSVDVKYPNLAILYFLEKIEEEHIKEIANEIDNILEYWNEVKVFQDCIILITAEPIEKSEMESNFILPIETILKENFEILIKSIMYA